jgi:4-hydroxy-tetrahydrodipicolinate synthase
MSGTTLHGVIAAIATAIDETGEPDGQRSIALARFLLDHGCDGLNVLGTTGEGTSFSLMQRQRLMQAYAESGLPLERMLVGTGAAALDDAIALTRHAAALGFAGALVLPPFYYKVVSDDACSPSSMRSYARPRPSPSRSTFIISRRSRDCPGASP